MIKGEILNGQLLGLLGNTGHGDWIAVSDSGLSVPADKECVDLALKPGIPRILDVIQTMVNAMAIEKVFIAEEIDTRSPNYHKKLLEVLAPSGCEVEYVPHSKLKSMIDDRNTRACVRSAEFTSYSSVLLQAGVTYGGEMSEF